MPENEWSRRCDGTWCMEVHVVMQFTADAQQRIAWLAKEQGMEPDLFLRTALLAGIEEMAQLEPVDA